MSDIDPVTPEDPQNTGKHQTDPDEPREGSRIGPYAIAAFVMSVFALWQSASSVLLIGGLRSGGVVGLARGIGGAAPAAVGAGVALWLATRGLDEIEASAGRLRGWSFCRAARLMGVVVFVLIGAAVVVTFLTAPQP